MSGTNVKQVMQGTPKIERKGSMNTKGAKEDPNGRHQGVPSLTPKPKPQEGEKR